jgi:hypothetical protein
MLKSQRLSMLGLLVCAGTVLAQTAPSKQPPEARAIKPTASPTTTATTATTTTATKAANKGEIYRWVDKNGKVQYSTDVPEDRKATARKVDTRVNIVSSRVPASIGTTPTEIPPREASQSEPVSSSRQPVTEREKCEAAWQRYNDAVACFAPYRQGINGASRGAIVAPEAFEKCQSLPEPAPCR